MNLSSDGSITNDGNLTLREAIAYVNQTAVPVLDAQRISGTLGVNDQIQFVSGLSGSTITLTEGELEIKTPVAILGNVLNIDGSSTIFDINVVGGPVGTVQISG